MRSTIGIYCWQQWLVHTLSSNLRTLYPLSLCPVQLSLYPVQGYLGTHVIYLSGLLLCKNVLSCGDFGFQNTIGIYFEKAAGIQARLVIDSFEAGGVATLSWI